MKSSVRIRFHIEHVRRPGNGREGIPELPLSMIQPWEKRAQRPLETPEPFELAAQNGRKSTHPRTHANFVNFAGF